MESEVKLSSGQVATKKENVKVRELAAAGNQPKGKEYLIPYATVAAKILIDGKAVVLEDVLDMTEDDFVLVSNLFIDEDDLKNA